jgi:cobalt/nickel transport system permease protein
MHIPDGFLSVAVSGLLWLVTIITVAYALKRVNQDLGERQVPMMGVLAAAIFAGQMLNFTVIGGTSGHLMGAALATILLGPWAAILVMATVVGVQALIFQDGGLLVLGANIFNMGIVGVAVSHFVYQTARRILGDRPFSIFTSGFAAAWFSIMVTALAVALQLAISGTSPANIAIPTMAGIHALIGIGEGLITLGALVMMHSARPDLVRTSTQGSAGGKVLWVAGLLFAFALAIASPLASVNPDGLEWAAEQGGYLQNAKDAPFQIIPDYAVPGVSNEALATILAGVIGTMIVFAVAIAVAYSRRKKQTIHH